MKNAGQIVGGNSAFGRVASDYYPTPPDVTESLLKYLDLPKDVTIWEPACGEGHMVKVLRDAGYLTFASDIRCTGFGKGGIDFLKADKSFGEWIITNPPFALAEDFIRKARSMDVSFAMLLKSQYWHSKKRFPLFKEITPSAILPLTWRPDFLFKQRGSGSPLMDVMWCVWDKNSQNTSPIYVPLERGG